MNYKKYYLDFFGYGQDDFVPCELCGNRAGDVHHIVHRSRFASRDESKNVIENLMATCRDCHDKIHHEQIPLGRQIEAHYYKLRPKKVLTLPELCSTLAALNGNP